MNNFSSEHKGNIAIVYSNVDKLDSSNAPELKGLFIHLNKVAGESEVAGYWPSIFESRRSRTLQAVRFRCLSR